MDYELEVPTLAVRFISGPCSNSRGERGPTGKSASTGAATAPGRVESCKPAGRTVEPESRRVPMGPKPPEVVADISKQLVREAAQPLGKHSQPSGEARDVHVPEEERLLLSSRHQAGHGVVQVQGELTPLQTGEVA